MKTTLFFLAHQDDEFGVFQSICNELKHKNVYFIYLTSGVRGSNSPHARNNETLSVLKQLGVNASNVIFVGEELNINDGDLIYNLSKAYDWLEKYFVCFNKDIDKLYFHAYEGGHPDHDAVYLLIVLLLSRFDLMNCGRQFPLYHSHNCFSFFFKALSPLASNGEVINIPIKNNMKLIFLKLIFRYKSQILTFMGLLPFIIYEYFIGGHQKLQKIKNLDFNIPPHNGMLYYEKRGFCSWQIFKKEAFIFFNNLKNKLKID